MNTPILAIGAVSINQDSDGRYSLNNLHQASGGEQRHRPKYWLENQQTKDLILELAKPLNEGEGVIPPTEQNQPVTVIQGGDPKKQGTYVARELVYSYAMWISPRFHLQVIRTFDAVMTGQAGAAVETLLPSEIQTLHEIVDARASAGGEAPKPKAYGEIYSRLQHKFRVNSYKLLPRTQLAAAILYVTAMDVRALPPAAPEPASPQISADDLHHLQRLCWQASHHMRYEKAWIAAFWAALRSAAGCPAPQRFEVRHLPVLAAEARRIVEAVTAYLDHCRALEDALCKQVLRRHADVGAFVARMQADEAAWKADLSLWAGKINAWAQRDFDALLTRAPAGGWDSSPYAEPVPALPA